MSIFSSTVFAADQASTQGTQPTLASFLPIILVMVVFYFFMIRPQMKKQKTLQQMISNLKKGDKVLTTGGVIGSIVKVDEEPGVMLIEIAPNVKIKIAKSNITELLSKETTEQKSE